MSSVSADVAPAMDRADRARMAPLVANKSSDKRVDRDVDDDDNEEFLPVRELRNQYMDYLTTKVDEIEEQKQSRHYYHGAQLTADQLRVLHDRRQPVHVWNRVSRKINGIVGLVERMRSDPKAFAATPKSEQGAEIATHAIRYVLDDNEFKNIDPWCLLQCCIDGVAGVQLVLSPGQNGDLELQLPWVIGDEYFYDAKSYRLDFEDNRYEGISKWVDIDEAVEMFPDQEDLLRSLASGDSDLTSNADRDYKWVIAATHRLRLVEHWYKHLGKWKWAFYVSTVLLDQGVSPFYDNKGKSVSSFRMFGAAVDHDGDRYGFVRNLKGPQDALNQGKSKTLHIANSRRLIAEKGAVDDIEKTRREWARADGIVEVNPSTKITPDQTQTELAAFVGFTEDAKNELEQYANTNVAAMTGAGSGPGAVGNLSSRAIELLRQPGMAELGPFILSYRSWKLQLYRMIWATVQRYWKAERWVTVVDDEKLMQFIQINGLAMDQFGRPAIINSLAQLDVKIKLDEGADVASLMQDTYDTLKGYPPGTFPPQILIEINPNIPRSQKDRLMQMLQPRQQADPAMDIMKRLAIEEQAAKVAKTGAEVGKIEASAAQARATADEKRANIGKMGHEVGMDHMRHAHDTGMERAQFSHDTNMESAQFARDTLTEAHNIFQKFQPPPGQGGKPGEGQPQPQPPPNPMPVPPPMPTPPMPVSIPDNHPILKHARRGRDGHHYIKDPRRPGKHMRVV